MRLKLLTSIFLVAGIGLAQEKQAPPKPPEKAREESSDLVLKVSVSEQAWVAVDADGKPILERVLKPHEVETLQAKKFFDITTDNAESLLLTFDNETRGHFGGRNEVKTLHLTRDGLEALGEGKAVEQPEKQVPPEQKSVAGGPPAQGNEGHEETQVSQGSTGTVYALGGDLTPPVPIYNPQPRYSETARRAKLHGKVTLRIVVDAQGNVASAHVLKGMGFGMDEKAVQTVRRWKFKPALLNGLPVSVRFEVEFDFRSF